MQNTFLKECQNWYILLSAKKRKGDRSWFGWSLLQEERYCSVLSKCYLWCIWAEERKKTFPVNRVRQDGPWETWLSSHNHFWKGLENVSSWIKVLCTVQVETAKSFRCDRAFTLNQPSVSGCNWAFPFPERAHKAAELYSYFCHFFGKRAPSSAYRCDLIDALFLQTTFMGSGAKRHVSQVNRPRYWHFLR